MKHAKTLFAITALSAALSSALWPGMASAAPAATVSAETWFGAEPASSYAKAHDPPGDQPGDQSNDKSSDDQSDDKS